MPHRGDPRRPVIEELALYLSLIVRGRVRTGLGMSIASIISKYLTT
jgi:hypothetical protein